MLYLNLIEMQKLHTMRMISSLPVLIDILYTISA